ncbi:MAG: hypothetical protein RBR42_03815 [Desulfomicrobium sp.]|nr:hypothetical protein [Desulfomicrobium sp.]
MRWIKALLGFCKPQKTLPAVVSNPAQDSLAVIDDLSRALSTGHSAVEIGSALGNIHRLRGELDQAIRIRAALLRRSDLEPQDQARIYFELGRDYSRAGLIDRARSAFAHYRDAKGDEQALTEEMALLSVKSGDFLAASRYYHSLGMAPQAAHYLVRAAGQNNTPSDQGLILEARELYPPSPESWLESLAHTVRHQKWSEMLKVLEQGLSVIGPDLSFLLLDPLFDYDTSEIPTVIALPKEYLDKVVDIIEKQPPNLSLIHYVGCLLRAHERKEEATTWQEKALLLNAEFWPARLELLIMALPEQNMTTVFAFQLNFLLHRAQKVKRFVCRQCGLKRNQIFFCCPKCLAWHSIAFRQLFE